MKKVCQVFRRLGLYERPLKLEFVQFEITRCNSMRYCYTEIMYQPSEKSPLYKVITDEQRELLDQGFHLIAHVDEDRTYKFSDYSFVVFPFAKAYEGFLKYMFLRAGFISKGEYMSKYFRVGKSMSPNLIDKLRGKSVYKQICNLVGCDLSEKIWRTWKEGRNEVFHFFPDNLRSLTLQEAEDVIERLLQTMEDVAEALEVEHVKKRLTELTMNEAKRIHEDQPKY